MSNVSASDNSSVSSETNISNLDAVYNDEISVDESSIDEYIVYGDDVKYDSFTSYSAIRPSGKTIYITSSNYDDYFYKFTGEIKENADILSGDILKIGNISNRGFVIDRQLTLTTISSNDQISNGFVHLIEGSDGSTVTGLTINNTKGSLTVNGVYVGQLHGIWLTKSSNNTISYNIIRIANAPGCYAMPMGWSSNNKIVYNDMKTYITCNMVMGLCHNNLIDNNKLEVLSYSTTSVTNLIYYNPFGHADYGGAPDCYNNTISNNYLKGFCTGEMSIILQLAYADHHDTTIVNNTVILGSIGISLYSSNAKVYGNKVIDSASAISVSGRNASIVNNSVSGVSVFGGISTSNPYEDSTTIVANNTVDYKDTNYGMSLGDNVYAVGNIINIKDYGTGISVGGNNTIVTDNIVNVRQDNGINFLGNNNIINANIINTKAVGIEISSTSVTDRYYNNTISNNKIGSERWGIHLKGLVYYTTISGNVIETNASVGIFKEITDEIADDNSDNMINGVIYDATALVINDDNFYQYFDKNGYLNYTFKENKTHAIFFTFLTNKNVFFTEKIYLISNKMENLLFNVTISLSGDASGSLIRDFNIFNQNKEAIILDSVSYVTISNNNITTILSDGSSASSAILVEGVSDNCAISSNNIYVNSKNKYAYGISISGYSSKTHMFNSDFSKRFTISDNNIIMISKGVGEAIYADCLVESEFLNNHANIISDEDAYGIATGNIIGRQYNLSFIGNEIVIHSKKMAYLIELHMNDNCTIADNVLYSESNGVYGIATYMSNNISIVNNHLSIFGGDLSNIGISFDALGVGNAAIAILKTSNLTNITNNTIYTNASCPIVINETAIVNLTNTSYVIDNNNYEIFFPDYNMDLIENGYRLIDSTIVKPFDRVLLYNLTIKEALSFNIPVNVTAYKLYQNESSVSLIFVNGSELSNIMNLTFINSSIYLWNTSNISIVNNSFNSSLSDFVIYLINTNESYILNNNFTLNGNNINGIKISAGYYDLIKDNLFNVSGNIVNVIKLNEVNDLSIFNNTMVVVGELVNLINSSNSKYLSVTNNGMQINGSSVYGYYGVGDCYSLIKYNDLLIHGLADVTNQAAIYIAGNAVSNDISFNKIISYSINADDYAIIMNEDEFLFNSVKNNYLISGNGSKRADFAVLAIYSTVCNNTPFEIYVSSNGSDITGDGSFNNPYATIEFALSQALNHCLIYLIKGTFTESNLTIDKNITIFTNSSDVIIDACGGQLFNITPTGILSINGLIIQNGFNVLGGGLFINNGTLNIVNSLIRNASAFYDNSNPVFIGDEYDFYGRYIYSYTADFSNTGMGGAILNYGKLNIDSSVFADNYAHKGGALADFGQTNINSSIFYNNKGVHGAVIFTDSSNTMVINNVRFFNNTAVTRLDHCSLRRYNSGWNIETGQSYSYSSYCSEGVGAGGCVFIANSPVVVNNSVFYDNNAHMGGAIATFSSYGEYSSFKPKAILEVYNSFFTNNRANDTRLDNDGTTDYYTFNSGYNGGVIYGTYAKIALRNSSFYYNQALSDGGALSAQSQNGTIDGCVFIGNRAGSSGGALHLSGDFLITNTIISNNSAYYGGAVDYHSYKYYGHIQDNLNLFNCTVSDNFALDRGGAFWIGDANITVHNSNIMNNKAPIGSTIASNTGGCVGDFKHNYWGGKSPDNSVWNSGFEFKPIVKNFINWRPNVSPDEPDNPTNPVGPVNPTNPPSNIPGTSTHPSTGSGTGTGNRPGTGGNTGGSGSGSGTGSGTGGVNGPSGNRPGSGGNLGEGNGITYGPGGNTSNSNSNQGSTTGNGDNDFNGIIEGIVNGTADFISSSRVNSSNSNSVLATVGLTDNSASASSSQGDSSEGSSEAGSSSSSSGGAVESKSYEVTKEIKDKDLDDPYQVISFVALVIIVLILLIVGYKRREDSD